MASTSISRQGLSAASVAILLLLVACGTSPSPAEMERDLGVIASSDVAAVQINEIRIDQPSTDLDEYFELAGPASTSLDGLTYLVIGDGEDGGSGVIEAVVDLSGNAIPSSGYFVVAESTFTLGTPDLVAELDFENSDNVTHLLVRGFTGSLDMDLDIDDDGTLDTTPWSEVLDQIALVESVGSGDQTYGTATVGPDGSFVPGHVFRCGDAFLIGAFGSFDDDTPGAANLCPAEPDEPVVIAQCGDPATLIHAIQGAGAESPLAGESVVIEGVVVGDFQDGDGDLFDSDLDGFFVQEEDVDADADPSTSEALFVYAPGAADVQVGDVVRVLGTVSEFDGMTQVTLVDLLVCGSTALPAATPVEFPLTSVDDLEAFEGMLVTFPQDLLIAEFFNFDRFGEIVLANPIAPFDRHYQPTSYLDPAVAAAQFGTIALNRITLDDGRTSQNPDPARHPDGDVFDLSNRFRGGDTLTNVTGVMHYAFGRYRVQPTMGADHTVTNPRPAAPYAVGGTVTVAAFNVLNYFSTLDGAGPICGPLGGQGCRGADDAEEFTRQRDKIFAALAGIDADVVGLVELENDAADAALLDLVQGLNDLLGAGTYAAVETGPIGADAIRVGLIYKTATVAPVGTHAVLDSPAFVDPAGTGDDKNRAALAQTFAPADGGDAFTVVVNHFKSKGSGCGEGDDDPVQGSCNLTRTLAAEALLGWIATDPTGSGDDDVLLVGDFNAYDEEDPIDVLVAAGYDDLLETFSGEDAYTYVFDGLLGHLDYAFASSTLAAKTAGATAWAINADEPDLLDYDTSFKQAAQEALYEPNAYRSSDHDPVIVGLELNRAPRCSQGEASVGRLWPPNHQLVHASVMGVTDPDGDPFTITIDGVFQDEPVDANGDGNTSPDAFIGSGNAFEVRAERDGEGNGRVYHVTFTASDGAASCTETVQIGVPVSQGRNGQAVDDGALFDSTVD